MQIVCQKPTTQRQKPVTHLLERFYEDLNGFNKTTNTGLQCHFGRTEVIHSPDMAPQAGVTKNYPKLDLMIFALKESRSCGSSALPPLICKWAGKVSMNRRLMMAVGLTGSSPSV